MESTTKTHDSPSREAVLLPYARRLGGWVFLWMGLAQGIVLWIFLGTSLALLFSNRFPKVYESWTVDFWLMAGSGMAPLMLAIGAGSFVLAVAGLPFGRWAGKAIGIQKRSIAWVGFMSAIVPAMFAGLVFVLVVLELKPIYFSWSVHSFSADFLLPVFIFSFLFYIPGILTSVLAGLVIRQKILSKEDEWRNQGGSHDPKDWTAID